MRVARSGIAARSPLLAVVTSAVLAAGAAAGGPDGARAEACPGSGASACPYVSTAIIGRRSEGVLRFPEAVALGIQGDVYVADQLSYVVQRFSPTGAFETEWGSYGGGHGQFGPIGGLATDPSGEVYPVESSPHRNEKFDGHCNLITSSGPTAPVSCHIPFLSS